MIDSLPQQKSMPHSLESERAVLGSCLLDIRCMDELSLRPEDFYSERHEEIFRTYQNLRAAGVEIDTRTVQADLEKRGKIDLIGGLAYITGLDLDLPDIGRVDAYAAIVKERAGRRQAIQIAGETIRDAIGGESLDSVVGNATRRLDALAVGEKGGGYADMHSVVGKVGAHLDRDQETLLGVTTGIPAVDSKILAMEPGQLWYVAARPGVGKTSLMMQLACREALLFRRGVGIVSLEMTELELGQRLAAKESGVAFAAIRRARVQGPDRFRVEDTLRRLQHAPIHIDDEAGQPVHLIAARARSLRRKHPHVKTIMADYLGLVSHEGVEDARQDLRLSKIAARLKKLAKDEGVSFVLLLQIGKKSDNEDRRPQLSDIKDGGEEHADGVIFLHRERDKASRLLLPFGYMTVGKNRGGETGEVPVNFDGPTMTWSEQCPEPERREPYAH